MLTKVYVDTNIIIDICDIKRPSHSRSVTSIRDYAKSVELYINSDSLATLFYILRTQSKLSFGEALEKMYFVREVFTLVPIDDTLFDEALELCSLKECTDYEDAVQYVCAKKIGADMIVTNDKKFASNDIEICCTVS
ncbi:MAG: PIN domain-containing protein [Sulfurovum sp.]|nr:PIN domain-containing protein [Sulfurovum sp.]MCB4779192.1 PIN domain-containing protein [Sulfurovum sp.]